jgi:hypothetical protein
MSRIRPAEEVKKEIIKRYNADPLGWQVLAGRDLGGRYELLFVHNSDLWLVKEEQINPYKFVGYGVREELEEEEVIKKISPYPFGLRPISKKHVVEMVNAMQNGKNFDEIIKKIMNIKPVSSFKLRSCLAFEGPIVYSSKPIYFISKKHRELDLKLRMQLEKLLAKKYPHVLRPYI